jgi:glycosyltransferase involved in cell wall biosynthesis
MPQSLVSLLTPCYNTGKYIHRLLDSVLNQSYSSIEMVVIDDGSTDNSKDVILSYVDRFSQKGYSLKYLYQSNSGQSVAIQNGLQYVNGKYLAWPDSDDFYAANDAIEKMVSALENASDEIAMVRTQEQLLDEDDLHYVRTLGLCVKKLEEKSLFEDCLFAKSGFYFPPGAYMVVFQKLLNSTEQPIFTAKNAGQNWQLMLPVLWNYRCISIPEVLYSVLVRCASHSRGQYKGYEATVAKIDAYMQTILGTLDRIKGMNKNIREKYKIAIKNKYYTELMWLAIQYSQKNDFYKYYGMTSKSFLCLNSNHSYENKFAIYFVYKMLNKIKGCKSKIIGAIRKIRSVV